MLAALILAPLFSDHMVLQRGQQNPIWGWDRPQQVITLTVEGAKAPLPSMQVTVGADGSWRLACPELPTGGPYKLHIRGSSEQIIDDVLVGEVWIASGQSNMEWKLPMTDNGAEEVASANDPQLRMFNVVRATSPQPLTTASGGWNSATPKAAADFSAVGYHFAKELRKKLSVPVGIINTSWGGTRVEAWTSREALRSVMDVEKELAALAEAEKDLPRIKAEYAKAQNVWERKNFPIDTSNEGQPRGWAKKDFDDAAWPTMELPLFWQNAGMKFNGCVWFRRVVEVPAAWAGHDLVLNLGAVDDFDTTYFNGEQVGATLRGTFNAYQLKRQYTVPAKLMKPGKNVIAVRVFDQFGDGGFSGPTSLMYAESKLDGQAPIPLSGAWHYAVEREVPLVPGTVYATAPVPPPVLAPENNPSYLFNGMIAPFVGYGIRGAIWYQGESNTNVAMTYRDRFTALIRDWRKRWGQGDFSFYFVQLANYKTTPGWPELREAQTQTLAEPNTGMAVILDIGSSSDIHPRNKRDVGHRLALLARAKDYGETTLEFSGPLMDKVEFNSAQVRVAWKHADGLRTRDGSADVKGFALAGADGVFRAASAKIDGQTVVVTSSEIPTPKFLRYAWADDPETNLENGSALPAAPFRTDAF
ncbi:MAG: sialate O-acetylesterase [Nibricoccus sp.]